MPLLAIDPRFRVQCSTPSGTEIKRLNPPPNPVPRLVPLNDVQHQECHDLQVSLKWHQVPSLNTAIYCVSNTLTNVLTLNHMRNSASSLSRPQVIRRDRTGDVFGAAIFWVSSIQYFPAIPIVFPHMASGGTPKRLADLVSL